MGRPPAPTPCSRSEEPGWPWSPPRASKTWSRSAARRGPRSTTHSSTVRFPWSHARRGSESRAGRRSWRGWSTPTGGGGRRPGPVLRRPVDGGRAGDLPSGPGSASRCPPVPGVSPGFREYERIATTVLNAYLSPEMSGYLQRLGEGIETSGRLVMTSAGGLLPFETAAELPGRLVLSGPAAGVVAAAEMARAKGHRSAISFDMGGTSTDVCRITDGEVVAGMGRKVAGQGESGAVAPGQHHRRRRGKCWLAGRGGRPQGRAESAGAIPGPVAYGRGGTVPTVTDANVVLGFLPRGSGSGRVGAPRCRCRRRPALAELGSGGRARPEATARGMIEIVDSHMERAIRTVSVEEGSDPRDAALIAFGGAGGLHASRLARPSGDAHCAGPPLSGVFSALGLLLARPRADATRTVFLEEGSDARPVDSRDRWTRPGQPSTRCMSRGRGTVVSMERCDMSVSPTSWRWSLIPDWGRSRASFEEAHRSHFGFDRPGEPIELVDLRAEVIGKCRR